MVSQAQGLEITQEAVTNEEKLLKDEAERLGKAILLLTANKQGLPITEQGAATLLERASKDLYGQGDKGLAGMPVLIQHIRADVNQARININEAIAQLNTCKVDGHKIVGLAQNIRSISSGMQAAEREATREALIYDQAIGRRIAELEKINAAVDEIFNLQINQMPKMRNISRDNALYVMSEAKFLNDYRNHMIHMFNSLKRKS